MKPQPDFTMDELLRELQDKLSIEEGGYTTTELGEMLGGYAKSTVLVRLKKLLKQGRVEVVKKRITTVDGKLMPVTAWKWVGKDNTDVGTIGTVQED